MESSQLHCRKILVCITRQGYAWQLACEHANQVVDLYHLFFYFGVEVKWLEVSIFNDFLLSALMNSCAKLSNTILSIYWPVFS